MLAECCLCRYAEKSEVRLWHGVRKGTDLSFCRGWQHSSHLYSGQYSGDEVDFIDSLKPFSDITFGKMRRIDHGVYPEFTFPTCTTQQEGLCKDASTTPTNPLHYLGETWRSRFQQTEVGSDVLTPLPRSHDLLDNTDKLSWHLRLRLLCVCHRVFTLRYLFSFMFGFGSVTRSKVPKHPLWDWRQQFWVDCLIIPIRLIQRLMSCFTITLFSYIYICMLLQSVSQEQRERRVTVDEVPSGIYLYPEEDPGVDNIFTPLASRSSGALFEEAQKEVLKLMKIEVC